MKYRTDIRIHLKRVGAAWSWQVVDTRRHFELGTGSSPNKGEALRAARSVINYDTAEVIVHE